MSRDEEISEPDLSLGGLSPFFTSFFQGRWKVWKSKGGKRQVKIPTQCYIATLRQVVIQHLLKEMVLLLFLPQYGGNYCSPPPPGPNGSVVLAIKSMFFLDLRHDSRPLQFWRSSILNTGGLSLKTNIFCNIKNYSNLRTMYSLLKLRTAASRLIIM